MAIAKANCTCSACGKTFEVRVSRSNSREARSFEKWAEENITECDDCKAARIRAAHEAENRKAAEAALEMGYAELIGTEKQIAWANTIRQKAMNELRETFLDPECPEKYLYRRLSFAGISHVLLRQRQAAWWIEKQNELLNVRAMAGLATRLDKAFCEAVGALQRAMRDGKKTLAQAEAEMAALMDAPAEKTEEQPAEQSAAQAEEKPQRPEAVPENKRFPGAVDIRIDGETVLALYGKNDAFMGIVKEMGFSWGSGWTIRAGECTGAANDIAAELGSRLLNAGFSVRFDSQALLDAAVRGEYAPMCHRWIRHRSGGFYISRGRGDDHYQAAKSLPGAKYDRPGVLVPDRSWDALEDFARRYGYRFTAKAQETLEALSGAAQTVQAAGVLEPQYQETDVLTSSREVLDDLRDDEGGAQ